MFPDPQNEVNQLGRNWLDPQRKNNMHAFLKIDICYFKIIIKVLLISKMILLMVVLQCCAILIFHCTEIIRSRQWDILTFSDHMASEVLNSTMVRRYAHSVTKLKRYLISTQMSIAKDI